jgi:hypothetical protein
MIRYLIFITTSFVVNHGFSQSKKEQIDFLNRKIDSLNTRTINLENQLLSSKTKLSNTISELEKSIIENKSLIDEIKKQENEISIELSKKNNYIKLLEDSIILLKNKELEKSKKSELYSFAFDYFTPPEIENQLKELVVKYQTYHDNDDDFYTKNSTTVLNSKLFLENNKINALLITLDRIHINQELKPQLNLNFYIFDCQDIQNPKLIYQWSSLLEECIVDHSNEVIDIQFTDLDNNGNVEIWIVNEKYCKGGVDMTDLLIYKYEDKNHCTLESMTHLYYFIDEEKNPIWGDEYIRELHEREPLIFDDCFKKSNSVIINYAEHLREKNIYGQSGFGIYDGQILNPKFWNRNKR